MDWSGTATVAKNSFPSSLPTPSITFSKAESVTGDRRIPINDELSLPLNPVIISLSSSSSSRVRKAQSISSNRKIECLGIEDAARCRKESSTL